MTIRMQIEDNKATLTITGEIDTKASLELSEYFKRIMDNDKVSHVILDLTTVPNISSAGIGKILKLFKYLNSKEGSLRIEGISTELHKLFKEIHLNKIISITA